MYNYFIISYKSWRKIYIRCKCFSVNSMHKTKSNLLNFHLYCLFLIYFYFNYEILFIWSKNVKYWKGTLWKTDMHSTTFPCYNIFILFSLYKIKKGICFTKFSHLFIHLFKSSIIFYTHTYNNTLHPFIFIHLYYSFNLCYFFSKVTAIIRITSSYFIY